MIKKLLLTLLFGILGVGVYGQTIKSLGYNTTNGQVVYGGTNALWFTNLPVNVGELKIRANSITWNNVASEINLEEQGLRSYGESVLFWSTSGIDFYAPLSFVGTNAAINEAITRTNLGLGWSALTNTNAANFRTTIGLGFSALTNTSAENFRSDIGLGVLSEPSFLNLSVTEGADGDSVKFLADGIIFPSDTFAGYYRTSLGLGNGITTNRTFVSYDGTNYTTNSVTISNGIITGWSQ